MRIVLTLVLIFASHVSLAAQATPCAITESEARRSENRLSALTQFPTPAFMILDQGGSTRFVSPAKVYADVLNTSDRSLIINEPEELRFLSQTLARSEILMILKGKTDFDQVKATKVLSVTKLLDIKLSMIWLGDTQAPKVLRDLVAHSGGRAFGTRDLLQGIDEGCKGGIAGR